MRGRSANLPWRCRRLVPAIRLRAGGTVRCGRLREWRGWRRVGVSERCRCGRRTRRAGRVTGVRRRGEPTVRLPQIRPVSLLARARSSNSRVARWRSADHRVEHEHEPEHAQHRNGDEQALPPAQRTDEGQPTHSSMTASSGGTAGRHGSVPVGHLIAVPAGSGLGRSCISPRTLELPTSRRDRLR